MLGRRGEFEGVADWLPVLPLWWSLNATGYYANATVRMRGAGNVNLGASARAQGPMEIGVWPNVCLAGTCIVGRHQTAAQHKDNI